MFANVRVLCVRAGLTAQKLNMEKKLQHSTNVHSEQVAPPDAKHLLGAVLLTNFER